MNSNHKNISLGLGLVAAICAGLAGFLSGDTKFLAMQVQFGAIIALSLFYLVSSYKDFRSIFLLAIVAFCVDRIANIKGSDITKNEIQYVYFSATLIFGLFLLYTTYRSMKSYDGYAWYVMAFGGALVVQVILILMAKSDINYYVRIAQNISLLIVGMGGTILMTPQLEGRLNKKLLNVIIVYLLISLCSAIDMTVAFLNK